MHGSVPRLHNGANVYIRNRAHCLNHWAGVARRAARMAHLKKLRDAKAKRAAAKALAIKLAKQAAADKAAREKAAREKAAAIAKAKAAKAAAKALAAKLAREKAARKEAERLAVIRRRKLRMQRLHAEAKNDNTGRCYYGRSAYGGCEIGGKRGGNGGGHKVIVVKPTKPAKKAIKNSSQCAAMCKAKGHCCNDWKIGSNQMVSCAQACEMRLNGVSKQNCTNTVNEFASKKGQGGCTLKFAKKAVSLCRRCKDLSKTCPHGVQSGKPGLDGCAAFVQ